MQLVFQGRRMKLVEATRHLGVPTETSLTINRTSPVSTSSLGLDTDTHVYKVIRLFQDDLLVRTSSNEFPRIRRSSTLGRLAHRTILLEPGRATVVDHL